jgi:sugar-specific transcriptional regulator TrmB
MITEDQLTRVGLSSKQAQVYLTLLEKGPSFLFEIAEKSKIRRTTLYPIVDKMVASDLLGIEMRQKRKKYFIKNPERLLTRLRDQKNFLEALMPQLQTLFASQTGGNRIQVYETMQGLRHTLEEIVKLKPGEEILTIEGDIRQAFRIGFDFWKELLARKKKLGIPSRTIVPSSEAGDFIIRDHHIKIRTSAHLEDFKLMIYLFSNKVLVIVPREPLCVLIENKAIKDGLKEIFEIMWRRAKPAGRKA